MSLNNRCPPTIINITFSPFHSLTLILDGDVRKHLKLHLRGQQMVSVFKLVTLEATQFIKTHFWMHKRGGRRVNEVIPEHDLVIGGHELLI